jgi:hypothetical protein
VRIKAQQRGTLLIESGKQSAGLLWPTNVYSSIVFGKVGVLSKAPLYSGESLGIFELSDNDGAVTTNL